MNRFRFSLAAAVLLFGAALSPLSAAYAQKETKPADKPAAGAVSPSQASIAAKDKKFGTIAAEDAKVKAAGDAKSLPAALKLAGKTGAFSGTVAKVFEPKGNHLVLLNFDTDYKSAITGVVRAANFAKFPNLKTLEGKKVLVSGKVVDYKGSPEVTLDSSDDIKIIK